MAKNGKVGRTSIVLLVLVVVILVCGVSISLFLLSKETQTRRATEVLLSDLRVRSAKIDASLKEAQKQIEVLTGKNKDADDKINGLMEELDLQAALREEIKTENKKLKEALEVENRSKIDLRKKLTADIETVQARLKDAEGRAAVQAEASTTLKQRVDDLQKKNDELVQKVKDAEQTGVRAARPEILPAPGQPGDEKVNLDRIVVSPGVTRQGKVLNVDTDTEFLIFDLGTKDGVKPGDVMSIYRGKSYLGDVKISRVQDDMSAADFIPPFSSRKVRKNDLVMVKR